jgi:hypothetical protein
MHDENAYFQYFALDFNEGYSALHGSDIFAQAHITNVAIDKIVRMYGKKSNMKIGTQASFVLRALGSTLSTSAVLTRMFFDVPLRIAP